MSALFSHHEEGLSDRGREGAGATFGGDVVEAGSPRQGVMSKPHSILPLILLGAVIAFGLANNLVWLLIDTRPPRWDEAHYLTTSLKYYDAFLSGGVKSLVRSLVAVDTVRPPLVPALAAVTYLLLGRSADAALVVNLLAFVLLMLAVYGLGARLASPWSGLLAAFLVSTYPGIFSLSRLFLLDFVGAALVAVFLYLLVRTEVFSLKGPSVALGVVIGLGSLCRAFFPVFVIGPLGISLYAAWREWRSSRCMRTGTRPRVWVNGVLALLVACALAAPWYVRNMAPVIARSLSAAYGAEAVGYGPSNPLTLHAMLNYFIMFTNLHTTHFGMVIFLLAAVTLAMQWSSLPSTAHIGKAKEPLHLFLLLLSAFIFPLLFFTSLPSQDHKNILPVLPAIAVISAWGLLSLRSSPTKKVLIGSYIAWSLFQFWIGTYGLRVLPREMRFQWGSPQLAPLIISQASSIPGSWLNLPRRENWNIPEVLSRVAEVSTGLNDSRVMVPQAVVAVVPDHALFNMNNFVYYSVLGRLPVQVEHPGDPKDPVGGNYKTQLLGADVAVIKTSDPGPEWLNPNAAGMIEFLRSRESGYAEIPPRIPLPDGSEAVLFAKLRESVAREHSPTWFRSPVVFGDRVELLGYDLKKAGQTPQGRAFLVTYYWRAIKQVSDDYQVFVHVTDRAGQRIVTGWDHAPARGFFPTSLWRRGTIIQDRGLYFLKGDPGEGPYPMRIGLYHAATGERLKASHAASGITLDDQQTRAAIGTIPTES